MTVSLHSPTSRALLAVFFIVAGVLHFAFIDKYVSVMPPWLPWHVALVVISGIAEIAGGVGVLLPASRRAAGVGLLILCVAVLPANVQMLINAHAADADLKWQALLALRLPSQLLLMFWIDRATRGWRRTRQ